MGNLMSTLYIGYVKEVIRDALGAPTFDLRVHVPAIHGFRVSDETKLPIARPLVIPGMTIMQEDLEAIYNDNLIGQRVIVFFESGNKTNPIYLGVIGQKPAIKEEETKTITPDFSSGNVVVTPTSGKVMTQVTINKDANLIADNIKSGVTIFGITGTYSGSSAPQENTYLTFQSNSPFTLNVYDNTKHWDGTLYYSTDLETWHEWDGTTTLSSVNNKLYLRGKGNTIITGDEPDYRWVLAGSNIECIGNIENLLDWEVVESGNHPSMEAYCYTYLFLDCVALVSAPALPAKTLTERCYSYMFYGCTALASPPALPATALADSCYESMFYGCTALTSAPALPATTLASNCYSNMFEECRSLTSPPALPATTLADSCYRSMFLWCTALTSTPALPATTLASSCYRGMFQRCTALTSAPALPATTLANYCYAYMFQGCTALASAPVLPATTLADSCYRSMFDGCTGLTTAPELPATTLADSCYRYMFQGCTALVSPPALPATTLADYCYYYMFSECRSLTSVPVLPAITLADCCYYGMFSGCIGLTTVPSLPATTLTYECYRQMFQYCPKIKVSAAQGGIYQHAWRIPTSGTGTEATFWNLLMLNNTGGTFTSNPSINTTYYVENPPV